MKMYVVGFLFSIDLKKVVLIEKNKPAWQKGKLNGVGGKVNEGEAPIDAMHREFKEEAGVSGIEWKNFHLIFGKDWEVWFFRAFVPMSVIWSVSTMESERVVVVDMGDFHKLPLINNLHWLIPMANSTEYVHGNSVKEYEE